MNTRTLRALLCTCLVFAMSGLVWAQEAQREFVPADSVAKQELPSAPLLYGAYAFVWVAVLVYVFLLWRRIGRIQQELVDVRRKLDVRASR